MPNPLRTYLTERNILAGDAAEKIGVSASFLSRLMAGEREADATFLAEVQAFTRGAVRPDDWVRWWRRELKERA